VGLGVLPPITPGLTVGLRKEAAHLAALADALRKVLDASGGSRAVEKGGLLQTTGQWISGRMSLRTETKIKDHVAVYDRIEMRFPSRSGAPMTIIVQDFLLAKPIPAKTAGFVTRITSLLKAQGYQVGTRFVEKESIHEVKLRHPKPLPVIVAINETVLYQNGNPKAVRNAPTAATTFTLQKPTYVTYVMTYHWNNRRGVTPGKISLKHADGTRSGPWQASPRTGQGGVSNVYWEVHPDMLLKPGTYTVIDSSPLTWSRNAQSKGKGIVIIKGMPKPSPRE